MAGPLFKLFLNFLHYTIEQSLESFSGGSFMPYYYFKKIWTPLSLIGIHFFQDEQGNYWVKFWKAKRRRLKE
jgi:hypothetical protein